MTSYRGRNEGPRRFAPADRGRRPPARAAAKPSDGGWIWGWHAGLAALTNPARGAPERVLATPERARLLEGRAGALDVEIVDAAAISRAVPTGAVHQGIALRTPVLEPIGLESLATPAHGLLVMLDQVTDPQNVGAIFRSAAAFGARGVILQERHAPPLAGALAKAAAGAIDAIPHARVVNLARVLERLEDLGWRNVGLDAAASETLEDVLDARPTVLVLGAEHEGLRRLVREHCDSLARIEMKGGFESLNVAAAAAVAFYETSRRR